MCFRGLLESAALWYLLMEPLWVGSGMALSCIIFLQLYQMVLGIKMFLAQQVHIAFWIVYFMRWDTNFHGIGIAADSFTGLYLHQLQYVGKLSCSFGLTYLILTCSLIKPTTSLIWSVGEDIHCMTALQNLDFFGWTPSLWKLVLVIHHQHTTGIDSVLSLFMIATRWAYMQHMRAPCHLAEMGYCFTTSKF